MTHAIEIEPNTRSAADPFSIHPIQLGRMQVRPQSDPIQPMDSSI